MSYVRKIRLTFLVGLTAFATLIAGAPHFICRCPDGHVKLFCVSTPSAAPGCCCGHACCRPAGRDEGGAADRPKGCGTGACCSAAKARRFADGRTCQISLQRNCCARTLAAPD